MVPYSNAILNLNNGPFKSRPTWLLSWIPMLLFGFGMAGLVHSSMITIQWKYNSVLILRAGQLGALIKYTSRLEGNDIVSNWTNLICTSNKHCCKYNRVVLSSFGKTNQLTEPFKIGLSKCSDFECVWCSVFEHPLYQTVQLFRAWLFFNFLLTGCRKSNKYCEGVILLCYKRSVIPSMIVSLLEHDDLKVRFANLVKGIGDLHSYIIQCPSLIRKVNYRCYDIGGSDIGGFFHFGATR